MFVPNFSLFFGILMGLKFDHYYLSTTLYELISIYSMEKKQRHGLAQFHSAWDQLCTNLALSLI